MKQLCKTKNVKAVLLCLSIAIELTLSAFIDTSISKDEVIRQV